MSAELALKADPHSGHRKLFTSSWTDILWIRKADGRAKHLGQDGQVYGLSPINQSKKP